MSTMWKHVFKLSSPNRSNLFRHDVGVSNFSNSVELPVFISLAVVFSEYWPLEAGFIIVYSKVGVGIGILRGAGLIINTDILDVGCQDYDK